MFHMYYSACVECGACMHLHVSELCMYMHVLKAWHTTRWSFFLFFASQLHHNHYRTEKKVTDILVTMWVALFCACLRMLRLTDMLLKSLCVSQQIGDVWWRTYRASLRLGGRKLPMYELMLRLLGVATMYGTYDGEPIFDLIHYIYIYIYILWSKWTQKWNKGECP